MKAITVTYLGPTNTRGSRLKAKAEGWDSVTVPYDQGHPMPQLLAVKALLDRVNKVRDRDHLAMPTVWGGLPNGDYVFCWAHSTVPTGEAWDV